VGVGSTTFMSGVWRILKSNSFVQGGWVVVIILVLYLLSQWQSRLSHKTTTSVVSADSTSVQLRLQSPPKVKIGEAFEVRVLLDTGGRQVNTVATSLTFPTQALAFRGLERGHSLIQYWLDDRLEGNVVKLTGGLPSPGFKGLGELASVRFIAQRAGVVNVAFSEQALVYENATSKDTLVNTAGAKVIVED